MLKKFHNTKGFTLIELLVVIAIIGILAAVAIPQFAEYRRNAYCSRVESDVNSTMVALESYYAINDTYTAVLSDLGVAQSRDVTLAITLPTGPGTEITVVGTDGKAECPKGTTYTIVGGTTPAWT